MECRIKKKKNEEEKFTKDAYFSKFLFFNEVLSKKNHKKIKVPVCYWTSDLMESKIFKTKKEAEKEARKCKLKNIEYERVN
jgi:hypothetical protein